MLLALLFAAVSATAQDIAPIPASLVETEAEGVVLAPPTHCDFTFRFGANADTFSKSMAAAETLAKDLRKTLNEAEIHPVELEVSAPAIRDITAKTVDITARARFSMSGFSSADIGAAQFADLCDKLGAVSAKLGCVLAGPFLEVDDRDALTRAAVTAATTNAYSVADSLALALSGRIDAVESVKVIEVLWNKESHLGKIEPTLRQLSCTAKVRVTYIVHAHQP